MRPELLIPALMLLGSWPLASRLLARWLLSRAKHPSLAGHARIAKRLARLLPGYAYSEHQFFRSDGAPNSIAERRRDGFMRLGHTLRERAPETWEAAASLQPSLSDLQFIEAYRVPFQYSPVVRQYLSAGGLARASDGVHLVDLDGNRAFDLGGSYGLNVFGYDFYKSCVDAGIARVRDLGPVLGAYHPVVEENVRRLREISGLDEVSFHMSGTEAVMQAVRLARYHTGRSHLVQFTGAYHGWWDGVQPGVGNPRPVADVYVLKEMADTTLRVIRSRRDIACVLVNPLQMLHPNAPAPGDGSLVSGTARAGVGRDAYAAWLRRLRAVCNERDIPLVFDEVFLGFRLAPGGAQEYFGVRADLVTYGKTVGGGLPVGVLCGTRRLMRRFHDDRPADICFARGTFNAHPYVMGAMNEFLRRLESPAIRDSYATADAVWDARAASLNTALETRQLPIRSPTSVRCGRFATRFHRATTGCCSTTCARTAWPSAGSAAVVSSSATTTPMPTSAPLQSGSLRPPRRWPRMAGGGRGRRRAIAPYVDRCCVRWWPRASGVFLRRRAEPLSRHQLQRRLVVQLHVVKRVGQDLRAPHQSRQHASSQTQLHGPPDERGDADRKPQHRDVVENTRPVKARVVEAGHGAGHQDQQRRYAPEGQQDDLAVQVVAHLDGFLVIVGRLVHFVVAVRLKEEMPDLAQRHGDEPRDEHGNRGRDPQQRVGGEEAQRAEQVQ
jgi:glutamate-1-semialdehyde 2,1-aminomutase